MRKPIPWNHCLSKIALNKLYHDVNFFPPLDFSSFVCVCVCWCPLSVTEIGCCECPGSNVYFYKHCIFFLQVANRKAAIWASSPFKGCEVYGNCCYRNWISLLLFKLNVIGNWLNVGATNFFVFKIIPLLLVLTLDLFAMKTLASWLMLTV